MFQSFGLDAQVAAKDWHDMKSIENKAFRSHSCISSHPSPSWRSTTCLASSPFSEGGGNDFVNARSYVDFDCEANRRRASQ